MPGRNLRGHKICYNKTIRVKFKNMPIKEPPVEKLPLFKEPPLEKKDMTAQEIVDAVKGIVNKTHKDIFIVLNSFMAMNVKRQGKNEEDKKEYYNKLLEETAELLGVKLSQSSENTKKTISNIPPKIIKNTVPYDSSESIAFATGLSKRDPED